MFEKIKNTLATASVSARKFFARFGRTIAALCLWVLTVICGGNTAEAETRVHEEVKKAAEQAPSAKPPEAKVPVAEPKEEVTQEEEPATDLAYMATAVAAMDANTDAVLALSRAIDKVDRADRSLTQSSSRKRLIKEARSARRAVSHGVSAWLHEAEQCVREREAEMGMLTASDAAELLEFVVRNWVPTQDARARVLKEMGIRPDDTSPGGTLFALMVDDDYTETAYTVLRAIARLVTPPKI